MAIEKQSIYRLYASGSADFVDEDGNVRPMPDLLDSMEFVDEHFPGFRASVAGLQKARSNRNSRRPNRRGGRSYPELSGREIGDMIDQARAAEQAKVHRPLTKKEVAEITARTEREARARMQ